MNVPANKMTTATTPATATHNLTGQSKQSDECMYFFVFNQLRPYLNRPNKLSIKISC